MAGIIPYALVAIDSTLEVIKDTWYVVGIGANADMGNQCTFYFDAEKNFKAHVKMPYRIEVGFRWEF